MRLHYHAHQSDDMSNSVCICVPEQLTEAVQIFSKVSKRFYRICMKVFTATPCVWINSQKTRPSEVCRMLWSFAQDGEVTMCQVLAALRPIHAGTCQ